MYIQAITQYKPDFERKFLKLSEIVLPNQDVLMRCQITVFWLEDIHNEV